MSDEAQQARRLVRKAVTLAGEGAKCIVLRGEAAAEFLATYPGAEHLADGRRALSVGAGLVIAGQPTDRTRTERRIAALVDIYRRLRDPERGGHDVTDEQLEERARNALVVLDDIDAAISEAADAA